MRLSEQVHNSLPGDWQTFTDDNIRLSEQVTIHPQQFAWDWQTFTDNNICLSKQVTIRPGEFAWVLADFH